MRHRPVLVHPAWVALLLLAATGAMAAAGAHATATPKPATPRTTAPPAATPPPAPRPAAPKAATPMADASRDVVAKGGSAAAVTEIPDSVPWGPGADDVLPVSCKMRPECRVDSDCAMYCGKGAGHCLESGCPILICECG